MKRFLFSYSLGIALFIMFFVSWVAFGYTLYYVEMAEAQAHQQSFVWSAYWWNFWTLTLENWQSESWQSFWLVVFGAYFIYKGSSESRDSDDEMKATIDAMKTQLDRIETRLDT